MDSGSKPLAQGRAPQGRTRILVIALLLALLALVTIPAAALWKTFAHAGNAAPDFTLVDQDGRPFALSAQRGRGVVLFFGYTHCTDVCPATLATLASLGRTMDDTRNRPEVVFVSVDPLRDTPAVLKRYLLRFDARFVGLTGNPAQIARVEAAYHTESGVEVAAKGARTPTIVHGASLFFIDARGRLRYVAEWNDPRLDLARDLRSIAS